MAEEYREKVVVREEASGPREVLARIIFYVVDVIEILLAVRFFLRAIQADAQSGFVAFIYRLSDPLVTPFEGIFPAVNAGGLVLEWATLLAMLAYLLIGMLIVRMLRAISPT